MAETTTTETPATQNDGATSTEAAAATLLTGTEPAATTEQTSEEQTAQPKTESPEPSEETKTATEGAPEKYEFSAPEGKEYDSAVLATFSNAAKEANLTQDVAQKLLESMAPALAERQQAQVKAVQDGWEESSKADKEFGGDKLKENLGIAKKALDTFATPELRSLLDTTGLGNNPEVIRLLYKVGKSISEDGFVKGSEAASQTPDWNRIMYDKTA